jgi:hypothetical protein
MTDDKQSELGLRAQDSLPSFDFPSGGGEQRRRRREADLSLAAIGNKESRATGSKRCRQSRRSNQ